jgi:hypothetical protein
MPDNLSANMQFKTAVSSQIRNSAHEMPETLNVKTIKALKSHKVTLPVATLKLPLLFVNKQGNLLTPLGLCIEAFHRFGIDLVLLTSTISTFE